MLLGSRLIASCRIRFANELSTKGLGVAKFGSLRTSFRKSTSSLSTITVLKGAVVVGRVVVDVVVVVVVGFGVVVVVVVVVEVVVVVLGFFVVRLVVWPGI